MNAVTIQGNNANTGTNTSANTADLSPIHLQPTLGPLGILQQVLQATPQDASKLPVTLYVELLRQAEAVQEFAKSVREFADASNELRYAEAAQHARSIEGRDFGVVRIEDTGHTVVCDTRKIVDWDQEQLKQLSAKITAAGDDPDLYMEVSRKVQESKFQAWPPVLSVQFEAARTVRPGKTSYRIERRSAALQKGGV
jgi:hypothetical protein